MANQFDMSSLLGEFREEARQQLDALDAALVKIESSDPFEPGERDELLRQLHTLKGNSAMMGLKPISDQVHAIETIFKSGDQDHVRDRIDRLFEVSATIRSAVEHLGGPGEKEAIERVKLFDLNAAPPVAPKPADDRVTDRADPASTGPPEADDGGETQDEPTERRGSGPTTTGDVIRVPFEKLDALLTKVGDIFAVHASIKGLLEERADAIEPATSRALWEQTEVLEDLASELRRTTMDLRLVPLKSVFGRFPSLVREIARAESKKVDIVISGDSVEVDKSAADSLAEPLLHLIRNAIDHGIETPSQRKAAGKDGTGLIRLDAAREGDQIRISVTDDGAGINRQKIRERAAELGLPTAGDELDLIFAPGFSTLREATTVSGRGIGLDIVRRSVTSLRGTLAVSESDPGTAFTLRLPLTLAIVQALIFETHGEVFAVPTSEVKEMLTPRFSDSAAGVDVIRQGDSVIPVVDPMRLFGWIAETEPRKQFPIVVQRGAKLAAIPADRLVDHRNVVVRPMPGYLGSGRGISGATIGTDGRVILLVDSTGLLELNMEIQRRRKGGE